MNVVHNFEDDEDNGDIFHTHGYAKIAYGSNLGAASPVPGGGRAGARGIGAVGTYRYADVSHRHKRDSAGNEKTPTADQGNSRYKLQVKEREGEGNGAAFSHRDPSAAPPIHTFREPPGRSYNPYT